MAKIGLRAEAKRPSRRTKKGGRALSGRNRKLHDMNTSLEAVTQVLARLSEGHKSAAAELMPLVYDELRRAAGDLLGRRTHQHTLQATALVHEAYLRMVGQTQVQWASRAHFLAVAAMAMRQVLSNYARAKRTQKRRSEGARVTLSEAIVIDGGPDIDLLALSDALERLRELDERQATVVEQRFLAGMTNEEIAHVLDVSTKTVEREWRAAQAWLGAFLRGSEAV